MADEKPSLHVDTDWKKQAQEEKRRLAEQEKQRAAQEPVPSAATATATAPSPRGRAGAGAGGAAAARGQRELPPASFVGLVQSLVAQTLFHLGDIAARGMEPTVNLDMAKHQIDMLGMLEEKTRGNLTDDDKRSLDSALYETRMRYVNVASQYIT